MPKREEQLTRAMVGRMTIQKRLTEDEVIELERREREQRALRKKFADGTGDVVKERFVSKQQMKKDKLAAREAELALLAQASSNTQVDE